MTRTGSSSACFPSFACAVRAAVCVASGRGVACFGGYGGGGGRGGGGGGGGGNQLTIFLPIFIIVRLDLLW